jgi:hypothetical protein
MTTPAPRLRTLLVLGRVSNLPTVWSNCLAAWLLNGGGNWGVFGLLCVGATLLYVGGMFLNDAFDAGFDREYRRERPIPSGQISLADVCWFGGLCLFLGWGLLFLIGNAVGGLALLLVAAIIWYDAIHKHTETAPFIMALCRLLLYLVAAAATARQIGAPAFWHGLALAAYIVGLSYLAREENRPGPVSLIPFVGVLIPLGANVWLNPQRNALAWLASSALLLWIIWCARELRRKPKPQLVRTITGLLAGIVLVDGAALPHLNFGVAICFLGLFMLARLLQRFVPAT